jgi:ribosomal protein L37AE/L43A
MAIPETQLDTWAHQGSIAQSSSTYTTIKRALEASDTKYAGKSYEVFLQGSYGNDTNIYAESDVDIVIRLGDVYHYDISALTAQEQASFNGGLVPATYPYADYKADVVAALVKSFGAADVNPDTKAVKIKANGSRRSADVVVATDFRRYYSSPYGPLYESGICFFTPGWDRIVNYPKKHSANCTTKHQATSTWFKPMVRILKNMRSRLIDDGAIAAGSAPSYFLEGLLYNVSKDKFGTSYGDTFVAAMNWILKADRTKLLCANEQFYLVRDSAAECWSCADCAAFLDAVAKQWNDWK